MTTLRTAFVLLAGASLLAACGPKAANTAASSASAASSGAPQAAAAPTSGPNVQITPDQLPVPKAGLWETTTTTNGAQPEVRRACESGKPLNTAKVAEGCSKFVITRTFLGAYVFDAVCGMGKASSTMHMTVQGDFGGGGYTTDGTATITIEGRPPMTIATHSVAKYVGPCPAGQQSGD